MVNILKKNSAYPLKFKTIIEKTNMLILESLSRDSYAGILEEMLDRLKGIFRVFPKMLIVPRRENARLSRLAFFARSVSSHRLYIFGRKKDPHLFSFNFVGFCPVE